MKKIIVWFSIVTFVYSNIYFARTAFAVPIIAYPVYVLLTRIMAQSAIRYAGHHAFRVAGATTYQAATARYMISKAAYTSANGIAAGGARNSLLKTLIGAGITSGVLNSLEEEDMPYDEYGNPIGEELNYELDENGNFQFLHKYLPSPFGGSLLRPPILDFQPNGDNIASNFTRSRYPLPPLYSNISTLLSYTTCLSSYNAACAKVSALPSSARYVSPLFRSYTHFNWDTPRTSAPVIQPDTSTNHLMIACSNQIDCMRDVALVASQFVAGRTAVRNLSVSLGGLGADPDPYRAKKGILHGTLFMSFERCTMVCTKSTPESSSCGDDPEILSKPHPFCKTEIVDTSLTPVDYYLYPVDMPYQKISMVDDVFKKFPELKNQKANSDFLADSVNELWKQYALDKAFPFPYDDRYRVDKSDVEAALKGEKMTVEQMLRDDKETTKPEYCPPPAYMRNGICFQEGEDSKPELGSAPNNVAPSLDDTPTISQVLDPVFTLVPTFKNFSVVGKPKNCAPLRIPFFKQIIETSVHCELLDKHGAILSYSFLFMWLVTALFIIMRA